MASPESVNYLVITVAGDLVARTTTPSLVLATMQSAVGGYIEAVPVPVARLVALVNEDGLSMNLPRNPVGTRVLLELGWIPRPSDVDIRGPVVFIAHVNGTETGLSNGLAAQILDAHSRVRQPQRS